MKSLQEYINENTTEFIKSKTRSSSIFLLKQILGDKKTKSVPKGFWINDGEGEKHEVYKYGYYKTQQFGVWVGPDNVFYPMIELSDDDIVGLVDHFNDTLNHKK